GTPDILRDRLLHKNENSLNNNAKKGLINIAKSPQQSFQKPRKGHQHKQHLKPLYNNPSSDWQTPYFTVGREA
ncbi:MAG: hypothetical protein VYD10_01060, partial [Actinomycetota bacterium]|nr:hypothetical protein [Actinomycetota bacterium]